MVLENLFSEEPKASSETKPKTSQARIVSILDAIDQVKAALPTDGIAGCLVAQLDPEMVDSPNGKVYLSNVLGELRERFTKSLVPGFAQTVVEDGAGTIICLAHAPDPESPAPDPGQSSAQASRCKPKSEKSEKSKTKSSLFKPASKSMKDLLTEGAEPNAPKT